MKLLTNERIKELLVVNQAYKVKVIRPIRPENSIKTCLLKMRHC